jgi:hypothetical protein
MNRLLFIWLIVFSLTTLLSCNFKPDKYKNVIKLELSEIHESTTFLNYFNLKNIIRLETSEKSIIGDIEKILFTKDKIYIVDSDSKSLIIFKNKCP